MAKRSLLLTFMLILTSALQAQKIYDVTDFGAIGNGATDDAAAIQQAIDKCSQEGGGRVLLPRNHTFLAGPVELKSEAKIGRVSCRERV